MVVYFDKSANQNLGGQKLKIFMFTILICSSNTATAGGDSGTARVLSFQKQSVEIAQAEIEWVKKSGFIAGNKETKLKFQLHQWPDTSFFVKHILTIFYDPYEKKFPKEKFLDYGAAGDNIKGGTINDHISCNSNSTLYSKCQTIDNLFSSEYSTSSDETTMTTKSTVKVNMSFNEPDAGSRYLTLNRFNDSL